MKISGRKLLQGMLSYDFPYYTNWRHKNSIPRIRKTWSKRLRNRLKRKIFDLEDLENIENYNNPEV